MGVCDCSLFCCTLLCVRSSIAIILMGKRDLVNLLNLSSWCLLMVELFLAVSQGCLRFVIVVFPDHTHLLFSVRIRAKIEINNLFGRDLVRISAKRDKNKKEKNNLFGRAMVRIRAKIKKNPKKQPFFVGFG